MSGRRRAGGGPPPDEPRPGRRVAHGADRHARPREDPEPQPRWGRRGPVFPSGDSNGEPASGRGEPSSDNGRPSIDSGKYGRHADTPTWADDSSWALDPPGTGDRLTPTTGPVTDTGWYHTDPVEPVERTDWTTWTTLPHDYDPLDDQTTTTHPAWTDDDHTYAGSDYESLRGDHGLRRSDDLGSLAETGRRGWQNADDWQQSGQWQNTGEWRRREDGQHHEETSTGWQHRSDPHRSDRRRAEEHGESWLDPSDWHETTGSGMRADALDALQDFPHDYGRQPDPAPDRGSPLDPLSGGVPAGLAPLAGLRSPGPPASDVETSAGRPPDWLRRPQAEPAMTVDEGEQAAERTAVRRGLAPADGGDGPGRLRSWLQLSALDTEVLRWWILTRIGILLVVVTGPSLFLGDGKVPSFFDRWKQWDFWHFDRIATHGYFAPGWNTPVEAFFPGLPLLLRTGHAVGMSTVLAGLLVSFVAGGVAAVALARLADAEWGDGAGRRAATMWMVAPPAIFLAAPYSESLFLAFAIPAWLAARRGRWWLAAVLAAGASSIRVSGIFLVIALAVEFVTSGRRREWIQGLWLVVSLLPVFGYMAYLKIHTGDWLRWYHAQAEGWYRGFTLPHQALIHTWDAATGKTSFGNVSEAVRANFEWMFRAELVAMLVGVVLTIVLLRLRRWGEATWVGIQVLAFTSSYWFFSVPRATLLWFPLWMGLAAISMRRPWVWLSYLLLSVPLFGVWIAAYTTGKWAG